MPFAHAVVTPNLFIPTADCTTRPQVFLDKMGRVEEGSVYGVLIIFTFAFSTLEYHSRSVTSFPCRPYRRNTIDVLPSSSPSTLIVMVNPSFTGVVGLFIHVKAKGVWWASTLWSLAVALWLAIM